MIELSSDTQTKPSAGMRAAMAAAEVGDEQRREDPTVLALEERAAAYLGHEESVYLPTATMANQIALAILGERGTQLIVEETAHIMIAELGGAAMHSGLQTRGLPGHRGRLSPAQIEEVAHSSDGFHIPRTSVVALENTHNSAGGTVWPLEELGAVVQTARRLGLAVHLDGARLANASVATGIAAARMGGMADTVTLCLSKGLGCPLGAVIAGGSELMARARVEKHRFGGAMRQAGIVAAAGVYALDHNVERLVDDHARARRLAEGWAERGVPVDPDSVETNFVQVDAGALGLTSAEAAGRLAEAGVRLSPTIRPGVLRAVTHLDVDEDEIERAIELVPAAMGLLARADELERRLDRALRERQAERLPSLAAAVVRAGETVWSRAVGLADIEAGLQATPETQYRVGSITKTFTAVSVMQLRDAGKLDLDDRLEQHLPGIANGSPTIRRMLSHLSGLQREAGEMFVTGEVPTIEEILESMDGYELVLPAARAHHYSNLAYGLLGEVVARLSGTPYKDYVDRRIMEPLGLARTTWEEQEPRAIAYLVDEFAGTAGREPHTDMGGVAAMGQLWSTVGDLCLWGAFLFEGADGVLAGSTVDEMWAPQSMMNPDDWTVGWGLGIELVASEGRVFGGHGGAMPGFLAGLYVNREARTGAAVLTNSGTRAPTRDIAIDLARATIELWPLELEPWRPEPAPPPEIAAILGHWWSEGHQFVFAWEGGKLTARMPGAPRRMKPTVFEPLPGGGFRAVEGRERGERLRIEGDRMVWAGYLFTRTQEPTPS